MQLITTDGLRMHLVTLPILDSSLPFSTYELISVDKKSAVFLDTSESWTFPNWERIMPAYTPDQYVPLPSIPYEPLKNCKETSIAFCALLHLHYAVSPAPLTLNFSYFYDSLSPISRSAVENTITVAWENNHKVISFLIEGQFPAQALLMPILIQ